MRHIFIGILLFIWTVGYSQIGMTLRRDRVTAAPPEIVTDGLVLQLDAGNSSSYPGSGTTWFDLSGNGNDGTLVNGVGYSTDAGGTLTFDGVDDYVNVSYAQTVVTNYTSQWTSSQWVKIPNTNTDKRILSFGSSTDNDPLFTIGSGGIVGEGTSSNENLRIFARGFTGGDFRIQYATTSSFFDNQWVFVSVVNDNSNVRIYKNGVFDSSVNWSSFSILPTNRLSIGSVLRAIAGNFIQGSISSTFIYDRALSATEIQQNFNATKNRFGL